MKRALNRSVWRSITLLAALIGVLALLSACGQQDSPVQAVENYLRLRVASDAPKLLAASCKDWESQASVEAASFQSMNAKLDGMACKQSGADGLFTVVACQGQIVTQYAGETRNWDLAAKNFRVVKEDGQWKMCGYQ
jgi:hypothetical protein